MAISLSYKTLLTFSACVLEAAKKPSSFLAQLWCTVDKEKKRESASGVETLPLYLFLRAANDACRSERVLSVHIYTGGVERRKRKKNDGNFRRKLND